MVFTALFFGVCWGFMEATLGYLVHLTNLPAISGFLLFPIGCYLMIQAYQTMGRKPVIFYTACVAACVKLTNFFFPAATVQTVINPAMAIMLESLILIILVSGKEGLAVKTRPGFAFQLVFGWRVIYLLYAFLSNLFLGLHNVSQWSGLWISYFLLVEGVGSGIFLLYLLRLKSIPWKVTASRYQIAGRWLIPVLFALSLFLNAA